MHEVQLTVPHVQLQLQLQLQLELQLQPVKSGCTVTLGT